MLFDLTPCESGVPYNLTSIGTIVCLVGLAIILYVPKNNNILSKCQCCKIVIAIVIFPIMTLTRRTLSPRHSLSKSRISIFSGKPSIWILVLGWIICPRSWSFNSQRSCGKYIENLLNLTIDTKLSSSILLVRVLIAAVEFFIAGGIIPPFASSFRF